MKHLHKLLTAFLLLSHFAQAQMNLVPNPSFEDTTGCPQWLGNFFAVGWYRPTYGSPDLFHTCSTGQLGVPQNVLGWQQPRTGLAYAGGHASDFSGTNGREYIQCRLNQALEAGEKYEVSFWLSRADSATKACNNIGAYFSATPVSALDPYNLPYIPQIVSQPNNPITDAINWTQVIDTFTAFGGEEYLTIGIFTNDANTNWVPTPGGTFHAPYYYIDDVSVEKALVNSSFPAIQTRSSIKLFPNPATDVLSVSNLQQATAYTLFAGNGQVKQQGQLPETDAQISVAGLAPGLYFLQLPEVGTFKFVVAR